MVEIIEIPYVSFAKSPGVSPHVICSIFICWSDPDQGEAALKRFKYLATNEDAPWLATFGLQRLPMSVQQWGDTQMEAIFEDGECGFNFLIWDLKFGGRLNFPKEENHVSKLQTICLKIYMKIDFDFSNYECIFQQTRDNLLGYH